MLKGKFYSKTRKKTISQNLILFKSTKNGEVTTQVSEINKISLKSNEISFSSINAQSSEDFFDKA